MRPLHLLRMPLHPDAKWALLAFDGFDDSVGGARAHAQPAARLGDRLMVQAVHLPGGRAQNLGEPRAREHADGVATVSRKILLMP